VIIASVITRITSINEKNKGVVPQRRVRAFYNVHFVFDSCSGVGPVSKKVAKSDKNKATGSQINARDLCSRSMHAQTLPKQAAVANPPTPSWNSSTVSKPVVKNARKQLSMNEGHHHTSKKVLPHFSSSFDSSEFVAHDPLSRCAQLRSNLDPLGHLQDILGPPTLAKTIRLEGAIEPLPKLVAPNPLTRQPRIRNAGGFSAHKTNHSTHLDSTSPGEQHAASPPTVPPSADPRPLRKFAEAASQVLRNARPTTLSVNAHLREELRSSSAEPAPVCSPESTLDCARRTGSDALILGRRAGALTGEQSGLRKDRIKIVWGHSRRPPSRFDDEYLPASDPSPVSRSTEPRNPFVRATSHPWSGSEWASGSGWCSK